MVPSNRTGNHSGGGSGHLAVFLATLVWSVSVCLMAWMVPAPTAGRLRGLPIPPTVAFWTVAAITVLLGWRVRREPNQGYLVLTGSLLLVSWFFLTLR